MATFARGGLRQELLSKSRAGVSCPMTCCAASDLSAPSPSDNVRLQCVMHLRSQTVRSDFLGNRPSDVFLKIGCVLLRQRYVCRRDAFAMETGQLCSSLRKFLVIQDSQIDP